MKKAVGDDSLLFVECKIVWIGGRLIASPTDDRCIYFVGEDIILPHFHP